MSNGQIVRWLGSTTPNTIGIDIEALSNDQKKFRIVADLIRQNSNKVDEESLRRQIEDSFRKQIDELVRKQLAETIDNMPSDSSFVHKIISSVNTNNSFLPTIAILDLWLSDSPDTINFEEGRDIGILKLLGYICDGKIECRIYPTKDDLFHYTLGNSGWSSNPFNDYAVKSQFRQNAPSNFDLSNEKSTYMHVDYRCGSGKAINKEHFRVNTYIIINCE